MTTTCTHDKTKNVSPLAASLGGWPVEECTGCGARRVIYTSSAGTWTLKAGKLGK